MQPVPPDAALIYRLRPEIEAAADAADVPGDPEESGDPVNLGPMFRRVEDAKTAGALSLLT